MSQAARPNLKFPDQTAKVLHNNKRKLSGSTLLNHIQYAWDAFLSPMLQRPKQLQIAALCHRGEGDNREFLLITSRDTARWIIPKGWPIRGLKANETALQEAWEEAGVKESVANEDPVGTYCYQKRKANGFAVPVQTLVYSVAVNDVSEDYPEASERERRWVSAETAAQLVNEAELKSLFRDQ